MPQDHPRPAGYRRTSAGYLDDQGRPVTDPVVLARVQRLAVPPGWRHVWISADPDADVQAVGIDRAGRTQYRYSLASTEARARDKFAHLPAFAAACRYRTAPTDRGVAP